MRLCILFLVLASFILSCDPGAKQKELELRERELALKEKELLLKEKNNGNNTLSPNKLEKPEAKSYADIKVKAYLIYRSGKQSSFDVLNDPAKRDGLFNTIIGEGVAEDWSSETKIVITGNAKNINLLVKNGDLISVNKKNIDIIDKSEFLIPNTGCENLVIQITADGKRVYNGKVPFFCGE